MNEQDPLRGTRGGQIPTLTPEQRDLASDKSAWLLADTLYQLDKSWFTRYELNLTPSQMSIVQRGCVLGIFKKDEAKEYWRKTPLARTWLLAALALRDEWDKSPEAQRIKDAISPKPRGNTILSVRFRTG